MACISIDDDDDYVNDRHAASLIKVVQEKTFDDYADDERSARLMLHHSLSKVKYQGSSCNRIEKKQEADDSYALYLNFYASKNEDEGLGFQDMDYTDADPQYEKFLSFQKPYRKSYALDIFEDGTSNSFTYEHDGTTTSVQPKRSTNNNAVSAHKKYSGMLHHISENVLDDRKGKGFKKSTNEHSETLGRSVTNDKMGAANAGNPFLIESFIGHPECKALKPANTESLRCSTDVSYQFLLARKFTLKLGEKLSSPQDLNKRSRWSVVENASKETSRNHAEASKVFSGPMFDGNQGKKLRLSQDSVKGANTAIDAKYVRNTHRDPKFRMNDHSRQKLDSKDEYITSQCQNLVNLRQQTIPDKVIQRDTGIRTSNDKRRKRHCLDEDCKNSDKRSVFEDCRKLDGKHEDETRHCKQLGNYRQKTIPDMIIQKDIQMHASNDNQSKRHKLAEDFESSGGRSVAAKVDQVANGTTISLRKTPGDKLRKNRRLSEYSEPATNRELTGNEAENASSLHALKANRPSGKKSSPKNQNQTLSKLKFEGQINDSILAFLSGLSYRKGFLVFRSEEGKVVTYEKVLTNDSDSDSDSVVIIGDRVNGITDPKYCSAISIKPSFQDSELDKIQTSKESFKKKLMDILRKPYDQDEYESLKEIAEKRKPLEGRTDLRRGRSGTYELESLGKSYLDHHKDVAKAVKKCGGDSQKILIILRGFIYWLKSVAHVGAFKPWLYKEYLEVQPRKPIIRKGTKSGAN